MLVAIDAEFVSMQQVLYSTPLWCSILTSQSRKKPNSVPMDPTRFCDLLGSAWHVSLFYEEVAPNKEFPLSMTTSILARSSLTT